MDERIKEIIARYIKTEPGLITAATVIDRTVVASSVIIHRMYAQLAAEGISVTDYTSIKTFGQLMSALNGKEMVAGEIPVQNTIQLQHSDNTDAFVGIDVEMLSAMPAANDYREAAFYKMNFAPSEIAYCILQPNTIASFAGLFAAKEAIIKADNSYKSTPFHSIIIDHLPNGKPVFPGFQISISHTNDMAVAVAIKSPSSPASLQNAGAPSVNNTLVTFVSLFALLVSILTLIVLFFRSC